MNSDLRKNVNSEIKRSKEIQKRIKEKAKKSIPPSEYEIEELIDSFDKLGNLVDTITEKK